MLTFDSGLERELILSASDAVTARTIRGAQPELVCDYRLLMDGVCILEIRENYLRHRRHQLVKPRRAKTIRLEVLSTHGVAEARVFEIRLYHSGGCRGQA